MKRTGAAHIYGKPLCQAEAFTSMNACDWTAEPWIFKDIGDEAFCEGLTRNVLCFWVHQPKLDAKPGNQWAHVGTHFDCNITWWPMADGWLTYLARCQHILRQGLFVADFAYLQDQEIPGFISKRAEQQPARPAGFDYEHTNRASTQRPWYNLTVAIVAANCMFMQQAPAQQAAAKPVAGNLEKDFVNPPDSV